MFLFRASCTLLYRLSLSVGPLCKDASLCCSYLSSIFTVCIFAFVVLLSRVGFVPTVWFPLADAPLSCSSLHSAFFGPALCTVLIEWGREARGCSCAGAAGDANVCARPHFVLSTLRLLGGCFVLELIAWRERCVENPLVSKTFYTKHTPSRVGPSSISQSTDGYDPEHGNYMESSMLSARTPTSVVGCLFRLGSSE